MAYIINSFSGTPVAVIPDGTIDTTSTTLQLVGRNVTEYGVPENENYVWLLENFAGNTAPYSARIGQLWYDSGNAQLKVRSNTFSWTAVADIPYVEAQKISPIFTGVPQAPTAFANTGNAQIATTLFVQNQKISPVFTGVPTGPTAPPGTANAQLATTEFVTNSAQLQGVPTAPTAAVETNTTQLATTAFVQAQKANIVLTGIPRAPNAAPGTNTTQIATTAFVTSSVQLQGIPTAPNALPGTNSNQIATTAFVTTNVQLQGIPTAPTANTGTATQQIATTAFVTNSPAFAGVPTAPTASNNTSNLQIATTAFVQAQKANIVLTGIPRAPMANGTIFDQIVTVEYVGNAFANFDLSGYALLNSPLFVGVPRAPTANLTIRNTQIATTDYVMSAIQTSADPVNTSITGAYWQGSKRYISTDLPNPGLGADGDFWFRYQP